jgi:hypothetical protein
MTIIEIPPETKARIMIGKFIRKHIYTEDFQRGRLTRKKLFKILNSHIRIFVAPDSGVTVYSCQQLANNIFKTYMETEEYQAYKELVYQARLAKMTPEQYFNAKRIEQVENDRSNIIKEDESEIYANMS